ncbi:MAG TPA: CbiQ family ECF transporter T component [Methylophilaceae bacterium]
MHPTIKLINLLILAIAINIISDVALFLIGIILILMLLFYRVSGMVKVLFRLRWLLFSLTLVYAFNTPGEYLSQWPFTLAPTYEGLHQGGMQMLRICLMMAGLTLFTATTNRQQIMAGFYTLLYPFKIFGFPTERFAARLWLTLYYVEHRQQSTTQVSIFQSLKSAQVLSATVQDIPESIELSLPSLKWHDVWVPCVLVITVSVFKFWLK